MSLTLPQDLVSPFIGMLCKWHELGLGNIMRNKEEREEEGMKGKKGREEGKDEKEKVKIKQL